MENENRTRYKINDEVLCILRKHEDTNLLELDYIKIENPLENKINEFVELCNSKTSTLKEIITFINTTTEINKIYGEWSYCLDLGGRYQNWHYAGDKKRISKVAIVQKITDFTNSYVTDVMKEYKKRYQRLEEKEYSEYFETYVKPYINSLSDLTIVLPNFKTVS